MNVIAAHCATKSGLFDPEYFHVFEDMLREHTNLYGDTSAFNVPMRGRHLRACLEPRIAERLIHGSDLPVPVFGHWAWARRFITWTEFRRTVAIQNLLERDYQIKLAMGFSSEHFTRINGLLPKKRPKPVEQQT